MLASIPSVDTPTVSQKGMARQAAVSASFEVMTCAHLSPGKFHAFDAETLRHYGCDILRSLYHHPDAPPKDLDPLLKRCRSQP
jgi:hypothetical protein